MQLLLLVTIIQATSCSVEHLPGRWKLRQVDLMDLPHQKMRFTLDLANPGNMKDVLYEANLPKTQDFKPDSISTLNDEINEIDTTIDINAMKARIDKYVASSLNSGMTLTARNKFYMRSNGLIVPTVVPGWQFGNTLEGRWTRNKDTLILSIGDDRQGYTWKFKILQETHKYLQLQEVFDGFKGSGNRLRFVRQ